MKILVTGGAGYIGSHCVMALLEKKYKVIILDNLSTGHIETVEILKNLGDVEFINCDLTDLSDISFEGIDAVMHFAAFSQVEESTQNPQKYYKNNVTGTINLLSAMLKYNIKKLIFSSTAAVYGEPVYTPIDENHPLNPINTYGKTKLMIENILDDYSSAYGLKSVRLRYFNVAGADSKCRIGEWHEPETHLIPNVLKNSNSFKLYGTDYNTKDGTCIRDYINVEDLAQAHILALEYLKNGGETNVFNLGTKLGYSVKEVFNICQKITNKNIKLDICKRRKGDVATLVADNSKVQKILGWQPQKSLEYSIEKAYRRMLCQ